MRSAADAKLVAELIDGTLGPVENLSAERGRDVLWTASADQVLSLIGVCLELDMIYEDAKPGTVWARFKERLGVVVDG